ncbi:putative membrane protein [Streptococcus mutans]|nr:putative membrane protein [Streptococcus mutans]
MHFPKFISLIMEAIPILLLLLVIFPNNKMRLFIYVLLVINALAIIYIYLKNSYFNH